MTLAITQRGDEASRTPDRPCYYVASAEVGGIAYAARARYGAANDIARQLVAAGIPDQPAIVIQAPQGWQIGYRSLYRLATRTVSEGPTTPIREVAWRDPAERFAGLGHKPVLEGVTAADASLPPTPENTPILELAS